MKLPAELRNSRKGPINIKNKNKNNLLWCRVSDINPVKIHPE